MTLDDSPRQVVSIPLSKLSLRRIPDELAAELGEAVQGFAYAGSHRYADISYFTEVVLVFDHPLAAYRLDVPLEIFETAGRQLGRVELRVRVKNLEVVPVDVRGRYPNTYGVARSELIGMRWVGGEGISFPDELPLEGTHPVVTLTGTPLS